MMQTKWESLIEQVLNVGSGFLISLMVWTFFIVPIWELPVNAGENIVITGIFTVVSVLRGYVWRRLFNHYGHVKLRREYVR